MSSTPACILVHRSIPRFVPCRGPPSERPSLTGRPDTASRDMAALLGVCRTAGGRLRNRHIAGWHWPWFQRPPVCCCRCRCLVVVLSLSCPIPGPFTQYVRCTLQGQHIPYPVSIARWLCPTRARLPGVWMQTAKTKSTHQRLHLHLLLSYEYSYLVIVPYCVRLMKCRSGARPMQNAKAASRACSQSARPAGAGLGQGVCAEKKRGEGRRHDIRDKHNTQDQRRKNARSHGLDRRAKSRAALRSTPCPENGFYRKSSEVQTATGGVRIHPGAQRTSPGENIRVEKELKLEIFVTGATV